MSKGFSNTRKSMNNRNFTLLCPTTKVKVKEGDGGEGEDEGEGEGSVIVRFSYLLLSPVVRLLRGFVDGVESFVSHIIRHICVLCCASLTTIIFGLDVHVLGKSK